MPSLQRHLGNSLFPVMLLVGMNSCLREDMYMVKGAEDPHMGCNGWTVTKEAPILVRMDNSLSGGILNALHQEKRYVFT